MADGLDWLNERQRDGGVDRIELPAGVDGELWLCGKRAAAARYGAGDFDVFVCLVEAHEIAGHHPAYLEWVRSGTGAAVWCPIPDLHAPALEAARDVAVSIALRLRHGERVLVHCAAGYGRSGTIAVCVLMELGMSDTDALDRVAADRPGAGPEVGAQRALVEQYAVGG